MLVAHVPCLTKKSMFKMNKNWNNWPKSLVVILYLLVLMIVPAKYTFDASVVQSLAAYQWSILIQFTNSFFPSLAHRPLYLSDSQHWHTFYLLLRARLCHSSSLTRSRCFSPYLTEDCHQHLLFMANLSHLCLIADKLFHKWCVRFLLYWWWF